MARRRPSAAEATPAKAERAEAGSADRALDHVQLEHEAAEAVDADLILDALADLLLADLQRGGR